MACGDRRVGPPACRSRFFSEKGVGPKRHPSFSLIEAAKPFRMAKLVWGGGQTGLPISARTQPRHFQFFRSWTGPGPSNFKIFDPGPAIKKIPAPAIKNNLNPGPALALKKIDPGPAPVLSKCLALPRPRCFLSPWSIPNPE